MHIYVLLNLKNNLIYLKGSLTVLGKLQFRTNTNKDELNQLLLINDFFAFTAHANAVT